MDVDSDPQTHDSTPEPSHHDDFFDDYVMGNDYTSEPEADADLQDYDFEKAPHMLILGGMQEVTPYHPSQAVSEPLLIPSLSSWDVISGNGKSQSASYWESLESPQSAPRRQGNGFCSSPTSLPYRPNPASQSGGHVAMPIVNCGMDNSPCTHTTCKHIAPAPPSCDHIDCYPPPDVGLLSRRFKENAVWNGGRSLAVLELIRKRSIIYSVPTEVLEEIIDWFPVVDPFTSGLEDREDFIRAWSRHKAFAVMAATCTLYNRIFYKRSWITKIMTSKALPAMATLFKEVGVQVKVRSIETLITQLPNGSTQLLHDCLVALPSLHTLWIMDDTNTGTGAIRAAFSGRSPYFPTIRRASIPICAHPLLQRLPNLEELACHRNPTKNAAMASVLKSSLDSDLKSFSMISWSLEWGFTEALVSKFSKLRKLCLPEPSSEDMQNLRGLKEIVELEIFVRRQNEHHKSRPYYNVEPIKLSAIRILQASECHKDCRCEQTCGCAVTNDCQECNPPKRSLRIKNITCSRGLDGVSRTIVDDEPRVEIQVSSLRVLSTK